MADTTIPGGYGTWTDYWNSLSANQAAYNSGGTDSALPGGNTLDYNATGTPTRQTGSTPGSSLLSGVPGQPSGYSTPPNTGPAPGGAVGSQPSLNPTLRPGGGLAPGQTATTFGPGGASQQGAAPVFRPSGGPETQPTTGTAQPVNAWGAALGGSLSTPTTAPATPPAAATPTTLPGTSYPYANPFSANPYLPNPTATNPAGAATSTTNFNPQYFPTQDTASIVANMLGGKVVQGTMLQQGGGGFTQNQPNYLVQLADGRVINPGNIASYYGSGQDPALLARLVNSEVTGGESPGSGYYDPASGRVIPNAVVAGTTLTPSASAALQGNPTNVLAASGQAPPSAATGNNILAGNATPANTATPGQAVSLPPAQGNNQAAQNAQLAQLAPYLQAFLQAYSQLGNGAGNPTVVNPLGQNSTLDPGLLAFLSSILGTGNEDQSLYSRNPLSYNRIP